MSSRKGADLGITLDDLGYSEPTAGELGAAQSTFGAGLPTPTTRTPGDLHYNTTDSKEYVLTGQAAYTTSGTDTFSFTSGGSSASVTLTNYRIESGQGKFDFTVTTSGGAPSGFRVYLRFISSNGFENTGITMFGAGDATSGTHSVPNVAGNPPPYRVFFEDSGTNVAYTTPEDAPGQTFPETRAWTSTDEYVATHTHTSTALPSTVSAGPTGLGGRVVGDFHHDTLIGREFVLTGAPGSGFVTETFDGTNGTLLNGKTTTTGGLVWAADTTPVLDGTGACIAGVTSGYARKGSVTLATVPQEVTFFWLPDPTYSYFTTYACATAFSFGGGAVSNGVNLNVGPISGVGVQTVSWNVNNLTTATQLATGSVSIDTGVPLKTKITRIGGVVTASINDVVVYTGTPAGLVVGNLAGWGMTYSGSTPKILDFSAGDPGTLAWVPTDPIYLQAQLVSGNVVVANHVLKPGVRVPSASILKEFVLRCETAPVGASLTVQVERFNGGVSQGIIATASIPTGQNVGSVTGLSAACAKGDILKFNVTSVGSSTAGADLTGSLDLR